MKTTAERLQEIMEERNLKQADVIELAKPFAERYGAKLTRPDMSQYCAGKVAPTQKKLFLLAAALNVDEGWLMGYDVDKTRKQPIAPDMMDSPIISNATKAHQEIVNDFRRHYFNQTITDDERAIISAYRAADDRTRRMIAYMLKLEDLTDADR